VLRSFTAVVIKIAIVSGSLLRYSRLLGVVYLVSLIVPVALTIVANSRMRRLRDANFAIGGDVSGIAMRAMSDREDLGAREEYEGRMDERKGLLQRLVATSQLFVYSREAALVGSQFIVVFLALGMREQLGITAGDFAKIIGYTTQVAAALIVAASTMDSVVSFSRAYHVYATGGRLR
jgi:ABC-type bacteriocin/lantibiotic exporter with double-glycine peptidase domain